MAPWAAIIGGKRDGKEAALEDLVRALRGLGLDVQGLLQRAEERDEQVLGYELHDVGTGQKVPLARASAGVSTLCDLTFDPKGFEQGRAWLEGKAADVVLLPVGKLELGGEGHWPAVEAALARIDALVVLTVRSHQLASLVLRMPDPVDALELPADAEAISRFAASLAAHR
jgi:nucleoside-triphosphatase THEP1